MTVTISVTISSDRQYDMMRWRKLIKILKLLVSARQGCVVKPQ